MLWQFQMGRGVHLPLVSTCFLYALVFPYIFLLFDCFEWALIDCIEKCRGHSALWQFQRGGPSLISSYYLTVSNGCSLTALKSVEVTQHSGSFKWGGSVTYIFLLFDCFKWACSLTILKSIEVTQHSGSFEWGGGGSISRFTLNLPILSSLAVSCFASQKVLFVLHMKDLMKMITVTQCCYASKLDIYIYTQLHL